MDFLDLGLISGSALVMQRHLIARAPFPMAVEVQGHKMQSSGLVQGLEQQVPAALSPSPAGLYIIFDFPACCFLGVPGSRGS